MGRSSLSADQFEHPRAAAAGGEAAKKPEYDDGGAGADEDVRRVCGLIGSQCDVRLQVDFPPHAHR